MKQNIKFLLPIFTIPLMVFLCSNRTANEGKKSIFLKTVSLKDSSDYCDTVPIRDFFLKGTFLTTDEMKDFKRMWSESVKSTSWPAVHLSLCDLWITTTNDYEKAVFGTTILDPFKKTALGKLAFKEVDTDSTMESSYKLVCIMHIQNIETVKLEAKNKQLEAKNKQLDEEIEALKEAVMILQQIENIYDAYLNK